MVCRFAPDMQKRWVGHSCLYASSGDSSTMTIASDTNTMLCCRKPTLEREQSAFSGTAQPPPHPLPPRFSTPTCRAIHFTHLLHTCQRITHHTPGCARPRSGKVLVHLRTPEAALGGGLDANRVGVPLPAVAPAGAPLRWSLRTDTHPDPQLCSGLRTWPQGHRSTELGRHQAAELDRHPAVDVWAGGVVQCLG